MISFSLDPVYVDVGLPALGVGILLGAAVTALIARNRRRSLERDLDQAETRLKNQQALEAERHAAFEIGAAIIPVTRDLE